MFFFKFLPFFHFFLCVFLIALVILQKNASSGGRGGAFGAGGSGASDTVFGSKGISGFLLKSTFILVFLFFITSLFLNYSAQSRSEQGANKGFLKQVENAAKRKENVLIEKSGSGNKLQKKAKSTNTAG